ncbi:hypothetical protein [Caballeronia sp. S22]|uniref:hypothetical protein n=1 Tax=Caballeronia sp. S22 TaxID=3137182 RepID=UPI00353068AE
MMRRIAVVGDKLSNDGEICDYKGMMFTLGAGHEPSLMRILNAKSASLFLALLLFSGSAISCQVLEFMESRIPLNSVKIPNSDRVKIAEMVIEARKWPDTQIRGVVQPAAYVHERNPEELVKKRGENLKTYLSQLGIREENFWIEPHVLSEEEAHDSSGNLDIHQLGVTLYPICEGGCDRLCNDPRVKPVIKAIR